MTIKIFSNILRMYQSVVSYELFEKYIYVPAPTVLVKKIYETKDKKENNELVNVIKSGLID